MRIFTSKTQARYNKQMLEISDEQFDAIISKAMDDLIQTHKTHMQAIKNLALVYADEPTERQRQELQLMANETLFGLYEGVPLARRQGAVNNYPPDKITIFKNPMLQYVSSIKELEDQVRHTLWHEVAHYFGLDHDQIHKLERT
jgi:predicted Zn-dependent protease with MMP-like domain